MRRLGVSLALIGIAAGLWFVLRSRPRSGVARAEPLPDALSPRHELRPHETLVEPQGGHEREPATAERFGDPPQAELPDGARLAGRALRSDGSLVLGDGVDLQFDWRAGETRGSETVPVTSGRFVADFARPGELERVTLEREDERPIELALGWRLEPGEGLERDLVFPLGCDCVLTIVDQRSRLPLGGTEVWLDGLRLRADEVGLLTRTDAFAPGRDAHVSVRHPDCPAAYFRVPCPERGGLVQRVLEVDPGFALGGIVVDARGAPQPDVTVRFDPVVGGRSGGASIGRGDGKQTTTDANGRFSLRGLVAGIDLGLVFLRGGAPLCGERITLPGDETRTRWVIQDALPLHGRVLDALGKPCPEVEVWASSETEPRRRGAKTDEEGAFVLLLPPGLWRLAAAYGDPPGPTGERRYAAQDYLVEVPGEVELRLPSPPTEWRRASFVLHARDAATGAPLHDVTLLVNGLDNTLGRGQGPVPGTGYVFIAFEGRFEVVAAAEGYEPARREIELRARSEPERLDVELVPRR